MIKRYNEWVKWLYSPGFWVVLGWFGILSSIIINLGFFTELRGQGLNLFLFGMVSMNKADIMKLKKTGGDK